jgi:hypothetical protein
VIEVLKPFFASFMPSLFSFDSYVTVAYSVALNESGEPLTVAIILENFEFSGHMIPLS